MKAKRLTPAIWTEDTASTVSFYLDTLGFTCEAKNDAWGWALLRCGDIELMISKPNDHAPFDRPTFTGSFYFLVEDVESLWQSLMEKCQVVYPLETFEWGMKEFAIYDNNGYILQFGEQAENENGR